MPGTLISERGRQRRGLGNSSFGDHFPGLLAGMRLKDIRVYLSDKSAPILPPHSTLEEKFARRELEAWLRRPPGKEEARRNHLAGGGARVTFERSCRRTVAEARRALTQMRRRR